MLAAAVLCVLLMFTSIPGLYDMFNVAQNRTQPRWTVGGAE